MALAGMFIGMGLSGAGNIPGQWGALDKAQEKAERLCRHTKWNLHRAEQVRELAKAVEKTTEDYLEPALVMAETAHQTWEMSVQLLNIDKTLMYINSGILAILMIMYVILAWFCLLKKRETLKEAFSDVYNIHFGAPAPTS